MLETGTDHSHAFAYPAHITWLSGIGTFFFPLCFVWSFVLLSQCKEAWLPAGLFPLSMPCLYIFLRTMDRVTVDDDGVTVSRLLWSRRIRYAEVTRLGHDASHGALVIHGRRKSIRIPKHIPGYPALHDMVCEAVSAHALEPTYFPLTVRVLREARVMFALMIPAGILAAVVAPATRTTETPQDPMARVVMCGLLTCAGLAGLLMLTREYTFTFDQVRVSSLIARKAYPVSDLTSMSFGRYGRSSLPGPVTLTFRQGRVSLTESQIDYPMEDLVVLLYTYYGGGLSWDSDIPLVAQRPGQRTAPSLPRPAGRPPLPPPGGGHGVGQGDAP